jgi:hypothetical protein
MGATMKHIQIFANKWWEADPLCWVALHDQARPSAFKNITVTNYPTFRSTPPVPGSPRPADPPARPRLSFECAGATVEVWCIQELMNPAENGSSSAEKARVLSPVLATPADLVVAFGTAGSRPGVSANGSVVIGRRVFIHDPVPAATVGKWTPQHPDMVIDSLFPVASMRSFGDGARGAAETRFLRPPIRPTEPPVVHIGNGFVSIGVVNITNYDDYIWADKASLDAFAASGAAGQAGSIETTHGIIRSLTNSPFLFVSGITDEDGLFDFQVSPRTYSQNVVAAHNAAIALCWWLSDLATLV